MSVNHEDMSCFLFYDKGFCVLVHVCVCACMYVRDQASVGGAEQV